MKQTKTNMKQTRAVENPSSERQDSSETAVMKKAKQQLMNDEMIRTIQESTGTHNDLVADRIIIQVGDALVWRKPTDDEDLLGTAISFMREIAPQNATESMLGTQMIATNEAALMFVSRATSEDQTTEGVDANVLRATRLMRVFMQQAEAMHKLRAKPSQQTLTVEQVNVHHGGQAIVGSVNAPKVEG